MVQKFSWNKLRSPFFVLAPMAGITDQPFRLICKEMGAEVLFSEMVSSEAIWYKKKQKNPSTTLPRLHSGQVGAGKETEQQRNELLKTLNLIKFSQKERPFIVQIFGANPEHMAYAAKYIASGEWKKDYLQISNHKLQVTNPDYQSRILDTKYRDKSQIQNSNSQKALEFGILDFELKSIPAIPDGIDLNMGCPARDVVKTGSGAALMKNLPLASEIISAVKKALRLHSGQAGVPVSVKTRLGWKNPDEIFKLARIIERAGADALTIHGRTVTQGFTGPVDWQRIAEVKNALKIPVIGNGGIDQNNLPLITCLSRTRPASPAVLRGRPNRGERAEAGHLPLDGYMIGRGAWGNPWIFKKIKNQKSKIKINVSEQQKVILRHARLAYQLKGERGIIEMRKHLSWYFRCTPFSKETRSQLVRVTSYREIEKILKNYKKH